MLLSNPENYFQINKIHLPGKGKGCIFYFEIVNKCIIESLLNANMHQDNKGKFA